MATQEQFDRAVRDLIWNIVEIRAQLEEIDKSWAGLIGISEPQWLMLMAVDELDHGSGVSAIAVANKLGFHPAFITTQTKKLEQLEFLVRATSPDDARFLQISLTPKVRTEIAKLSDKRQAVNSTILNGLDEESLAYLNKRLNAIAKNSRLASQKLSLGLL